MTSNLSAAFEAAFFPTALVISLLVHLSSLPLKAELLFPCLPEHWPHSTPGREVEASRRDQNAGKPHTHKMFLTNVLLIEEETFPKVSRSTEMMRNIFSPMFASHCCFGQVQSHLLHITSYQQLLLWRTFCVLSHVLGAITSYIWWTGKRKE